MFKWIKLGKVFTPQNVVGLDWLSDFAQGPATLLFDDFVRVYFSCRPAPDAKGQYVSYSAFVDLERSNLLEVRAIAQQPILTLGGLGMFDEFGTYPVSVIRHEGEILAYYGGWTRCESVPFNVAIGIAISRDDGQTFTRNGLGPVLGYTPNEPFVVSGPKIRRFNGIWYLWYIAGRKWKIVHGRPEPVYKIRMAWSTNGIQWVRHQKDIIENRIESDEAQASPDVFYANGRYHMFFCYRYSTDYRNKTGGYRIGYASSTNLFDWQRDDDKVGINISETGWDSEMQSYPHVFEMDGQIYMLYLGNDVGREGFGLAVLDGELV